MRACSATAGAGIRSDTCAVVSVAPAVLAPVLAAVLPVCIAGEGDLRYIAVIREEPLSAPIL